MRIAACAVGYFGVVFAIGFALGIVRVLLVAPALGERVAELCEMPVMIAASIVTAWWLVRRFGLRPGGAAVAGVLALALLVGAEIAVVLGVRGIGVSEYVAGRDPVAGAAYAAALGVFMLAPPVAAWWLRRCSIL
jgi:hypothetical protein